MRRKPPLSLICSCSISSILLITLGVQSKAEPIQWELVDSEPSKQDQKPVRWSDLPPPIAPINQNIIVWKKLDDHQELEIPSNQTAWEELTEEDSNLPDEAIAEQPAPGPIHPVLIPPPQLQALDRSVAFKSGFVGPDISWNIPNGFRWSERWLGSASFQGQNRRHNDGSFYGWNDGDAVAIMHANILQSGSWSIGINTSIRSVYQGDRAAGGSTKIGEGVASGFRIATAIGQSGGIAFGGEQVVQWDDKTDTGRNFYLMATKGWWLSNEDNDYPLLIANGGFGTGRYANQDVLSWNNPLRFACIKNIENRINLYSVDNDLCWSPIGSLSVIFNDYVSTFVEYRSGTAQVAGSISMSDGIPLRLTWGIDFAIRNRIVPADELRWVFRTSIGF